VAGLLARTADYQPNAAPGSSPRYDRVVETRPEIREVGNERLLSVVGQLELPRGFG
jgi:hypothetical protein